MIISQLELRLPVVWKINFNQTGRRDKATSHRSTTMINNNDQQQWSTTVTSFLRRAGVDQEKMLKVYTSSVRSVLEYAVPVWQSIPKNKNKTDKLWNIMWKTGTYITLIKPFSKIDLFPSSVYFLTVQALREITPKRHLWVKVPFSMT